MVPYLKGANSLKKKLKEKQATWRETVLGFKIHLFSCPINRMDRRYKKLNPTRPIYPFDSALAD